MNKLAPLALLLLPLALVGCSDPKTASKENFKTAINEWIEKNPPCISVPSGTVEVSAETDGLFPRYVELAVPEHEQRERAKFDAMVDAGLLTVSQTSVRGTKGGWGPEEDILVHAYELSGQGKEMAGVDEQMGSSGPQFCYGVPTVDEIVQFTEPVDAMGVRGSQVRYRYHLRDIPAWATHAKMLEAFPELARDTATSIEDKDVVILTNNGWVHQRNAAI